MRKYFILMSFLLTSAANGAVTWRGDYETGNTSQWFEIEGLASRLTVVQSPARQGKYALRTELRSGDYASSGCRNELSRSDVHETEGTERWYAWSTMFDETYPSANTWQVFTQWHHNGPTGSPPLEFDVVGENLQLSGAATGSTRVLWTAPLRRGVWHDFVVHVRWSASSGSVELWYDGQKALEATPFKTLYDGQYVYLKQGLYRDASIQQTAVVYHDGMRVGDSLADVAPELAAPPVVPPAPEASPAADAGTPVDSAAPAPVAAAAMGFPNGGCSSAGVGIFSLLGLAVLFARRRSRA